MDKQEQKNIKCDDTTVNECIGKQSYPDKQSNVEKGQLRNTSEFGYSSADEQIYNQSNNSQGKLRNITNHNDTSADENKENQSNISLGKFKDTEALLKAYGELSKEFTKKCQLLSQLTNSNTAQCGTIEESTPPTSAAVQQTQGTTEDAVASTPIDVVGQQLDKLYMIYPQAINYHERLVSCLSNNPELSCSDNSAILAYLDILQERSSYDSLACDDKFLSNYIYNNQSVVDTIVRNYLSALSSQHSPTVISKAGSINLTPPHKPNSIKEASEMAVKFFK